MAGSLEGRYEARAAYRAGRVPTYWNQHPGVLRLADGAARALGGPGSATGRSGRKPAGRVRYVLTSLLVVVGITAGMFFAVWVFAT